MPATVFLEILPPEKPIFSKGDYFVDKLTELANYNKRDLEFALISLIDNKIVNRKQIENNPKCKLTAEEMNQVENFAHNNNFSLRQLHDEILSKSEFIAKTATKGGKKQDSDVIKNAEKNYKGNNQKKH